MTASSDLDPEREFLIRAANDRERLAQLSTKVCREDEWRQVAESHAELESLTHRLAGCGGTFGHPAVSKAATRIERLSESRRLRPPKINTRRRAALMSAAITSLIVELDAIVAIAQGTACGAKQSQQSSGSSADGAEPGSSG